MEPRTIFARRSAAHDRRLDCPLSKWEVPSLAMRCVKSLSISSKRKPTRSGRISCGTGAVINRRTDRVGHEIL